MKDDDSKRKTKRISTINRTKTIKKIHGRSEELKRFMDGRTEIM